MNRYAIFFFWKKKKVVLDKLFNSIFKKKLLKIIKKEREGKGSGPSNRPNGGNPDGQGASKVADDKNASEAEPGPKPSY